MPELAPEIERMERRIGDVLTEWNVPGASVAVFSNKAPVLVRGYGTTVAGKDNPVDEDTRFPIGSLTKAFIAAAIGLLVGDGKLFWDDPVRTILPEFALADRWVSDTVTIRDLLSHRTGLGRAIRLMWKDVEFDPDDFIRRARFMQFDRGFREGFGYANIHYVVAGAIIEAISGMPWGMFLRERIFIPMGMTSTFATWEDSLAEGSGTTAMPHANRDGGAVPGALRCLDPVQPIQFESLGRNAAGAMVSTARDMAKWLSMLLHKGVYDGRTILPPEVVDECLAMHVPIRQEKSDLRFIRDMGADTTLMGYGLGWYLTGYRNTLLAFHDGQTRGSSCAIAFSPILGHGAAILTNVYHTAAHQALGFELLDSLSGIRSDYCGSARSLMSTYREMTEARLSSMQSGLQVSKPSIGPDDCSGVYANPVYGEVVITSDGSRMEYRYGHRASGVADLEHRSGDRYCVCYRCGYIDDEMITFTSVVGGRAAAFELEGVGRFERMR